MLAFHEHHELLRIGSLQGVQVCGAGFLIALHLFEQVLRPVLPEGFHQECPGVFGPALREILLGNGQAIVFLKDLGAGFRRNVLQFGDLLRKHLQIFLRQVSINQASGLVAQKDKENGCLANPGQVLRRGGFRSFRGCRHDLPSCRIQF